MDRIKERCRALEKLTGLKVQLLDSAGMTRMEEEDVCEYCHIFKQFLPKGENCQHLHSMAASRAKDIGEAYLFPCHAGMCHVVCALDDGAVLAGPFLLGELEAPMLQEVSRNYPIPASALLDMYEAALDMKALSPKEAGALIQIMGYLFDNGQVAENEMRRRGRQQRQISESIQMYKGFQGTAPTYPYEKEQALIRQVKAGDTQKAGEILNDLLGYALFSTGGGLDTIKSWTAELCALLSRASIECGVQAEDALRLNHTFMRTLWEASTLENLCLFMQEAVERFCASVFPSAGTGVRATIARATRYIHLHYAENITLVHVAQEVHLSESYLSSLFKRVTGTSLRAYLNSVRIDEARRLLAQDDLSITEIAVQIGFDSQSYFSKVFRKITGITPKEYRKELHHEL